MAVRFNFGVRPGGAFPFLSASDICLLWCSIRTSWVSVCVRSVCRPSIVGEAGAWVLGPGTSLSDLVFTRLTNPVILRDRPSSIGVGSLGASASRGLSQLVGVVGLFTGGECSGVPLVDGDTCQTLSMTGVVGVGVWGSEVWGEPVWVGVLMWGGVDVRLIELSEDALIADDVDSVDVLVATVCGTWVVDSCSEIVSVVVVGKFGVNVLW